MLNFRWFLLFAIIIHCTCVIAWHYFAIEERMMQAMAVSSKLTSHKKSISVIFNQATAQVADSAHSTSQSSKDLATGTDHSSEVFWENDLYVGTKNALTYARFVAPKYPQEAIDSGITGEVLLRVLVDKDGKALEVEVLKSSHPVFDDVAKKSAMLSTYMHNDNTLDAIFRRKIWIRVPLYFTLRK